MGKVEPVMTPEEAAEAEATAHGPIVAVWLARITLRGEGITAPTIAKINAVIATVIEDVADETGPDNLDAPIPYVRVTSERVDK